MKTAHYMDLLRAMPTDCEALVLAIMMQAIMQGTMATTLSVLLLTVHQSQLPWVTCWGVMPAARLGEAYRAESLSNMSSLQIEQRGSG